MQHFLRFFDNLLWSTSTASSSSFVCGFSLRGLPDTGQHHHLQTDVWSNFVTLRTWVENVRHRLGLATGRSTLQVRQSVRCYLFLQAPQWPWIVLNRFSKGRCCWGRSKPGCRIAVSAANCSRLPTLPPRIFDVSLFSPAHLPHTSCEGRSVLFWLKQNTVKTLFQFHFVVRKV